jgi:hypothetical protein
MEIISVTEHMLIKGKSAIFAFKNLKGVYN